MYLILYAFLWDKKKKKKLHIRLISKKVNYALIWTIWTKQKVIQLHCFTQLYEKLFYNYHLMCASPHRSPVQSQVEQCSTCQSFCPTAESTAVYDWPNMESARSTEKGTENRISSGQGEDKFGRQWARTNTYTWHRREQFYKKALFKSFLERNFWSTHLENYMKKRKDKFQYYRKCKSQNLQQ